MASVLGGVDAVEVDGETAAAQLHERLGEQLGAAGDGLAAVNAVSRVAAEELIGDLVEGGLGGVCAVTGELAVEHGDVTDPPDP